MPDELNILNVVNKFNIIESIDSPFLEMDIQIVDATNLLEEHKINGNEKISIIIQRNPIKGSKQNKVKFELNLRIAEVFAFVKNLPTKQFYRFRCVSEHLYINASKTLVRPFEGTIGSLIEKICKYYDLPERVLIKQYVIKKLDVRNILTLFYS